MDLVNQKQASKILNCKTSNVKKILERYNVSEHYPHSIFPSLYRKKEVETVAELRKQDREKNQKIKQQFVLKKYKNDPIFVEIADKCLWATYEYHLANNKWPKPFNQFCETFIKKGHKRLYPYVDNFIAYDNDARILWLNVSLCWKAMGYASGSLQKKTFKIIKLPAIKDEHDEGSKLIKKPTTSPNSDYEAEEIKIALEAIRDHATRIEKWLKLDKISL